MHRSEPPPFFPIPDERWLAAHVEPVIDPGQRIVDAHHHLWQLPGWQYTLGEYHADLSDGHAVAATVYLQCRSWYRPDGPHTLQPVGETEYAEQVARRAEALPPTSPAGRTRVCAAIVPYADLRLGAGVDAVLDAHLAASPTRFRGIRHGGATDPDPEFQRQGHRPEPGLFGHADFRAGFARLAARGLSFDAWLYHPQLDDLVSLARAFPDATIVLNHVGGPLGIGPYAGQRDAVFAQWRAAIDRVAACDNVVCKLGGLGMRSYGFGLHEAAQAPGSAQLADLWRPYVDTCIAAFGTRRCMFESNFPVDRASCSYRVLWNAFKRLASRCSADEKADLFHRTAERTYRIDGPV